MSYFVSYLTLFLHYVLYSRAAPNIKKYWHTNKNKNDADWAAEFPDNKATLANRVKDYFAENADFAKYDRAMPAPRRGVQVDDSESEDQDNTTVTDAGALDCDFAVRCIRIAR